MQMTEKQHREYLEKRGVIPALSEVERLPRYHPYDSKTEQVFAKLGAIILRAHIKAKVLVLEYHPMAFLLLGETYRIDFMAITEKGAVVFIETKGSKKVKNYRDARSKLRAAAAKFPYFTFIEARWVNPKNERAWEIEFIKSE